MYIFYSIIALIPILALISFYLLRKWKQIYRYSICNGILVLLYTYVILYSGFHFFEQDPWELKKIFLFLYLIAFHAIGSFTFALFYHYKLSKKWESIKKN